MSSYYDSLDQLKDFDELEADFDYSHPYWPTPPPLPHSPAPRARPTLLHRSAPTFLRALSAAPQTIRRIPGPGRCFVRSPGSS